MVSVSRLRVRIGVALLLSALLHGVLIFVVTFVDPEKKMAKKETPKVMDVVLFDPRTVPHEEEKNEDARTIANKTVKGNPKQAHDHSTRRAAAPPPAKRLVPPKKKPRKEKSEHSKKSTPKHREERKRNTVIEREDLQARPEPRQEPTDEEQRKERAPRLDVPLANLIPSTMALSELSRDFERERRLQQMLSNEADIPINTREAKYAPYAHALVRALEEQWRPGDADYKRFSERDRQVLMRLTIEYNGKLGGLDILRASPIPSLNESAVEAIYAAAPFKPLPRSWGLERATFYLTFEVVDDRVVFRSL